MPDFKLLEFNYSYYFFNSLILYYKFHWLMVCLNGLNKKL